MDGLRECPQTKLELLHSIIGMACQTTEAFTSGPEDGDDFLSIIDHALIQGIALRMMSSES